MLTLTITETRPNLNVTFFRVPAEFINYIQKYNDIRNRTSYGYTTSADLLTRTSISTFDSQTDVDTYLTDPECEKIRIENRAYNVANGIIGSVTIS